jgi:hypothetical protein
VTGTVNGNEVTYASFYGITTAIGSSPGATAPATTVPTSAVPGDVNGVALVFIPREPQRLAFTSTPPSPANVGGTYSVAATGGASGNPATFSIDETSTAGTCSLSGTTLTFNAGGTCIVDANQAGTHEYAPAAQAQQTITVAGPPPPPPPPPGPPTVTNLRVAPFRAGASATLDVTLSEPANLTFIVTESSAGHRAGKRCRAGVRKHAKRCTVVVQVARLAPAGASGRNALKLALTKLAPGTYTGTLIATNAAGKSSAKQTVNLTVTAVPVHKKRRRR